MSVLGKQHIRFDRGGNNYLQMIVDKIKNGEAVDLKRAGKEIIHASAEVKAFIDAVESKDTDAVYNMLVAAGLDGKKAQYVKMFNGKGFTDILKAQFTGNTKGAKTAKNTGPNERCSLYAIEMAFRHNGFRDKGEFLRVCGPGLAELNNDIDEEWESTFYNTQKAVFDFLRGSRFDHYSRDGGFMAYISKAARQAGVTQKDNWNPADLWLVKDFNAVKSELDELLKTDYTVNMLNEVLKRMYTDRRVVGISLKKASRTASVKEMNCGTSAFDKGAHAFEVQKISMSLDWNEKTDMFAKKSTSVFLKSKTIDLYMQIKNNTGNLKFESTIKGVGAEARAGQAAIGVVLDRLKAAGVKFDNDSSKYPGNKLAFEAVADVYEARAKAIKKFRGDLLNDYDFKATFSKGFEKQSDVARSLLMQIDLLSELDKLSEAGLNDIFTEIAFSSLKIGGSFGPFIKVS